MVIFNMKKSHGGSERFGPCECCNKPVDTTFHLWSLNVYLKPNDERGLTHYDTIDKFGHYDCLAALTMTTTNPLTRLRPSSGLQTGS